mgnify:FL=1|jgi:hypothetical protein|tara:strand:- start:31 stop:735 length:705 start_codon:yes stop_codon:yes gene_type:complete
MAGISYSDLRTNIRNYTEVSSTVLSDSVIENIVLNAEYRIFRDVPMDAYRASTTGNLVTNQDYVNVPAGALVVRAVQVYTSTSVTTGANVFLEKKDLTFLEEYVSANTSTGSPKYYAMKGGATGNTSSTSGAILLAPVPDSTYEYQIHYNRIPDKLEATDNETSFISLNFPNGLLYACLVEAYGYLKGPADMLQLYEQKYKQEVERFGGEQLGSRKRDDYADGTIRIPVNSPTP